METPEADSRREVTLVSTALSASELDWARLAAAP